MSRDTEPNRPVVTVTIETNGYRSSVDFPLGTDAGEAFPSWLKMQMDYLGRWKPGMSASIMEKTPTAMKVAVCEYMLSVNEDHDTGDGHKFIPPTAIDWLGDGIVTAILAALRANSSGQAS